GRGQRRPRGVDGGCTMNGIEEFPNTAVAFFSYDGSAGQEYEIVGTDVAASDAYFRLRQFAPRDDYGCFTDGCELGRVTSASMQGTITLQAPSPLTTDYTVLVSRVAGTG